MLECGRKLGLILRHNVKTFSIFDWASSNKRLIRLSLYYRLQPVGFAAFSDALTYSEVLVAHPHAGPMVKI